MLDDWFQNVAVKFHYSNKPETWFVYGLEVGVNGFDAVGPADPSARISEWQQAGDVLCKRPFFSLRRRHSGRWKSGNPGFGFPLFHGPQFFFVFDLSSL